ncbi:MAG TPA: single-stranded-DNA-specific exonuclease RecJ [Deltaproteobacteria bacterium]|nr:single-stranded-DNA-specific exonuclease RecJ [Deltaproteobacteria bacterium]HOI07286.1 single-stranded-DNA-specific exonuclease RecJ [Deltaproteobacteria bacterium]
MDRNALPDLKFTPLFKSLMKIRGLNTPNDVWSFLSPNLGQLRDPSVMKDMHRACVRIVQAIENRERIGIFTDYDVDGVCSAVLMQRFLTKVGCSPPELFIPDRVGDGYGLNTRGIEELKSKGVTLLITADCGITSISEVAYARSLGMDVIVTDHHELGPEVPDAHSILNPKQSDCPFFGEDLCGAGVVFHLIIALRSRLRQQGTECLPNLRDELDLVAMATIADAVSLSGINRVLVKEGLNILNASGRVGLAALAKVSGLNRELLSRDVGFILGPRINAAGRLSDARKAFDLLITEDEGEATRLARELNDLNRHRQVEEQQVLNEALSLLEAAPQLENAIVVAGTGWHAGVIGIVASRLAGIFSRPAVVISLTDGVGIGSGRSVAGVDLHAAVSKASAHLNGFGGHKMAVGLSIDEHKILPFAQALDKVLSVPEGYVKSFEVDLKVSPFDITPVFLEELEMLGPFGEGNPEPVFMMPSMEVVSAKKFARGQYKLLLKHSNRVFHTLKCTIDQGTRGLARYVDVAFTPVKMRSNGYQYLYLALKAISPAGHSPGPAPSES